MKSPPWRRGAIPMWQRLGDFTVALGIAGGVLFALGLTALYLLQKFLI
jgi:hypothetical protein